MQPLIPILIVTRSLDIGGAERHLLQVLPRLDQTRFSVEVFSLHPGGGLAEAYAASGLFIYRESGGVIRWPRLLSSLVRYIWRRRPLVHTFLPEPYLVAAPIALGLSARGVLMSRRSRNFYQVRHPFAAWCEQRLHGRMDGLLANSRAVACDLLDEGAPRERVRLIYNGIDTAHYFQGAAKTERRRDVRRRLGLADDCVMLVCIANLFHYKGHADLIVALSLLGTAFSAAGVLLCIGRDAGEGAPLEAQAKALGLAGRVIFLGERHDIPDLLAAADISVLASHEEGFSNAVLEGMAAGLPMVVTDVGGNAEAVIDEQCGYVVPSNDPVALSAALAKLINNPLQRTRMGGAARMRVESEFSIETCVAAYEALYEEVWERCGSKP